MGKKRKNEGSKINRNKNSDDASTNDGYNNSIFGADENSFIGWTMANKYEVLLCVLIGVIVGAGLGMVVFDTNIAQMRMVFTGQSSNSSNSNNRNSIARGDNYNVFSSRTFLESPQDFFHAIGLGGLYTYFFTKPYDEYEYDINGPHRYITVDGQTLRDDPSHPLTFAILRESVIREKGGFVHPDLGLLVPAPSGAGRGLGMVRDSYNTCQTRCMPGTMSEKLYVRHNGVNVTHPAFWDAPITNMNTKEKLNHVLNEQERSEQIYKQEEVLLKIPLGIQMTRKLALATLEPLIPNHVLKQMPLQELDDAALLVLLLAHERGRGIKSIFQPYIASLPLNPGCGFSPLLRDEALKTITIMSIQLGMDVSGWPGELNSASDRADVIVEGLTRDYGQFLAMPNGVNPSAAIQWALCHVASRATAGAPIHGALRLIPILDMINHDANAGGFEELLGRERIESGNYVDATEDENGTFIVRSIRYGRRKQLRKGQELLVNYNVPNYSPLDWFVSLGFVPPERTQTWTKVENVLPKKRTYSNQ